MKKEGGTMKKESELRTPKGNLGRGCSEILQRQRFVITMLPENVVRSSTALPSP